MRQDKAI